MNDQLPEITEVQRLRLEPGDALVVRTGDRHLSMADADQVKERVRAVLGGDIPVLVLVLPDGFSLEVVDGYSEHDFRTWLQKEIRINGGLSRMTRS